MNHLEQFIAMLNGQNIQYKRFDQRYWIEIEVETVNSDQITANLYFTYKGDFIKIKSEVH